MYNNEKYIIMKKLILIAILFIIALTTHAQFTDVNVGTSAGSGDGDNLRAAFVKVNANFAIQADSNAVFRTSIGGNYNALADSLAVHLDTLQAHCVSINNLIDSLAIHLDTLQQFRTELNATPFITTGTYIYPRTLTNWLGIGTATPGAMLDVAGHIWQTSTGGSIFLGEGAGASDLLLDQYNVFIGYNAASTNTSGRENIAIGLTALNLNVNGSYNTAVGLSALYTGVSSSSNVAIGNSALYSTTGSYNTAVGLNAGLNNTTGTY